MMNVSKTFSAKPTVNQLSYQKKEKICKFNNQGSCSHESNHGNFRHHYSFCARLGRILTHPEVKCNTKLKQEGQTTKYGKQLSAQQPSDVINNEFNSNFLCEETVKEMLIIRISCIICFILILHCARVPVKGVVFSCSRNYWVYEG